MPWPDRSEDALARAIETVGLDDFGDDDEFRLGLEALTAAVADAGLPPALRERIGQQVLANLVTRLRLVALRKARPQIAAEVIDGPLVVIGLPRTGTSALVDLLAQDPGARAPLQWEVQNLFPPTDKAHWRDDPRIAAMEAQLQAGASANPIVALGLHSYGARLPDECNSFLGLEFWSPGLSVLAHLPAYSQWLEEVHLKRPYRSHRWVLQHLQHHGPAGRWTLKSPFHVFDLPALLAEYPDAVFVQPHRDPLALMPSMCGLYATIRGEAAGDPRRCQTGRELCALWGAGLRRALAARDDPSLNARVFDISHRDLARDPMGVLASVYQRFDLPFSEATRSRAQAWALHPAQHRSRVSFTLEDFGLAARDVEDAFGDYAARFGAFF